MNKVIDMLHEYSVSRTPNYEAIKGTRFAQKKKLNDGVHRVTAEIMQHRFK